MVLLPTGDVVGVVEAVGVVSAGLRLCRLRTGLVLARLAKRVGTPLASSIPAARLSTQKNRRRSALSFFPHGFTLVGWRCLGLWFILWLGGVV